MQFNENQIKAINHYTGNCAVLASAGSGKTSVLIHRIVNLITKYNVSPSKIIAITFSRKAADNMKNRLKLLLPDIYDKVAIDTFHAIGYKILRENGYYSTVIKEWEKSKIINEIIIKDLAIERDELEIDRNSILNFISFQKSNLLDCQSILIDTKHTPYSFTMMKKIYTLYEQYKSKENKIDFDDMILNCYKLLESNDSIRLRYQNKFKFILCDEMQDTDVGQYELLRLLGKTNNNVFCVGDPLQCIYEFRLANNNFLINFYKDWDDTTVINLNTNYRSTDNIVKISNNLVKNIKETTHAFYVESIANNEPFNNVVFNHYQDEVDEADSIAKMITNMIKNNIYQNNDFAILSRTNFQAQAIEAGLYKEHIPYEVVDGKPFYERKEINDLICFLRLAMNNKDDESFKKIYNTPNRYLGSVFLQEIQTYATKRKISLFESMGSFPRCDEWRYKNGIRELEEIIHTISKKKSNVGIIIQVIRNMLNYDKYINKDGYENNDKNDKIENLDILVTFAEKFKSIKDFLNEIDSMSTNKSETNNAVKIMTIHKSKGLEFPVVFVTGINNLILPHIKSDNINEERRLLYVAMTRAEKELYLSSTEYYGTKINGISEFIYDIFDEKYLNTLTK
jgi:DNA helicase-2/ATP-dependent DNA helicase PcrA